MERNITINVTRHEATVIFAALGTLKNRTAQKARWQTVKRMRTLRQRLAVAITIGDEQEQADVRRAIEHSEHQHRKFSVRAADHHHPEERPPDEAAGRLPHRPLPHRRQGGEHRGVC